MKKRLRLGLLAAAWLVSLVSCTRKESAPAPRALGAAALTPAQFNAAALRLDLPLHWRGDANGNHRVDPEEIVSLLFYGETEPPRWVEEGRFTPDFERAYARIREASRPVTVADPVEAARRRLVAEELDAGRATLVHSDLRALSPADKDLVRGILRVAHRIDALHRRVMGVSPLAARVAADDPASRRLLLRNWGPHCVAPRTEKNPACSALPGAPPRLVDLYPPELQRGPRFCEELEKHPAATALLDPFAVVRARGGKLVPVPYTEAYAAEMRGVAKELRATAAAISDPAEGALRAYLQAAAESFLDNRWERADEAWARMDGRSSRWYLRVGPDEVYGEPCSRKAAFHLSFGRIHPDSSAWQAKLGSLQQEMENALAALIGKPYVARRVRFRFPDLIRIVLNAGDSRMPFFAVDGQSLPNWGKVSREGRGRTVVMTNVAFDVAPEEELDLARSLFSGDGLLERAAPAGSVAFVLLHEATHNLGPSYEYRHRGQSPAQAFGGGLANMLEELKANSGALWYLERLRARGILSVEEVRWASQHVVLTGFARIARGMYTDRGAPKPYGQLAAIQLGLLLEEGALRFDARALAANGADRGAFRIDFSRLPAAAALLMKRVGRIKATHDRAGAELLVERYVRGSVVPKNLIAERVLRRPLTTYVYALDL